MKFFELVNEHSKLMLTQFQPQESDPKRHGHGAEYQLTIPLIGAAGIELNGKLGEIAFEQRVVTMPGEQHRHFGQGEATRLLLVNFQQEFLEQVVAERAGEREWKGRIEFASWGEGRSEQLRKVAEQMIRQSMTGSLERVETQELEWKLAELLLDLQEGSHAEFWRKQGGRGNGVETNGHPAIRRALELMQTNFAEELSLDHLAEAAGISKFHLARLFRDQVGATPSHYLSQVRLAHAELLLRTTSGDVTSIAFEAGFGSLSAFERAFKRQYGVTPTAYRKST